MTEHVRNSPRLNKLLLTAYVNREGEEQKTAVSLGRTLDVSATGAGMEVYQELKPGSRMDLEFDLQDSLLTVQGKIVHVRLDRDVYIVGIEFDERQERLASILTPR